MGQWNYKYNTWYKNRLLIEHCIEVNITNMIMEQNFWQI
jgi:hypothetical protein